MPDQVVIETHGVEKVYSDNGVPVNALRGIDLRVGRGEFTAVVGPSGSGKTTLFNLLSGLDFPTRGEVWLSGKKISAMSGGELSDFRRDHIGFVFQAYNLIPVLTVEENVEYIMLLQGVPKGERRARVHSVLADVGLEGMEERLPTRLSGGQQQRVAVARAIVADPSLILADEPTANLDSKTGSALLDLMRQLNDKKGVTFLFSTHDQMIMDRARRLVTLKDGRIASDESRA
jgi:putative ABC transport system ATP-binding protein